jgi:hypothetical protein
MNNQNCNILNWNIRGLNNPARRKVVSDLIKDTRSSVASSGAILWTRLTFQLLELVEEPCRPWMQTATKFSSLRTNTVTTKIRAVISNIEWYYCGV